MIGLNRMTLLSDQISKALLQFTTCYIIEFMKSTLMQDREQVTIIWPFFWTNLVFWSLCRTKSYIWYFLGGNGYTDLMLLSLMRGSLSRPGGCCWFTIRSR